MGFFLLQTEMITKQIFLFCSQAVCIPLTKLDNWTEAEPKTKKNGLAGSLTQQQKKGDFSLGPKAKQTGMGQPKRKPTDRGPVRQMNIKRPPFC